tara:strand:+ start:197 stop:409 length:213 start_codon:yes stop_codon:yes gene_type:complete
MAEYYKYYGSTHRVHQKMRASKRRKINKTGEYAVIVNTQSIGDITLSDGTKWKNMNIKWGSYNSIVASNS